jgi:hypothetical protein
MCRHFLACTSVPVPVSVPPADRTARRVFMCDALRLRRYARTKPARHWRLGPNVARRVPAADRNPEPPDPFHELSPLDPEDDSSRGAGEAGTAARRQRLPPPPLRPRGTEADEKEAAFRSGVAAALRVDGGRAPPRPAPSRRRDSDGSGEDDDSETRSEDDSLIAHATAAAAAAAHAAQLNPTGAFWRRNVATGLAEVYVPLRDAAPMVAMREVTDLAPSSTPVPKRYAKPHPDPHGPNSKARP